MKRRKWTGQEKFKIVLQGDVKVGELCRSAGISGITYVMDADKEKVEQILNI